MLEIEIDGKKLTVPDGTMMDAAHQCGTLYPAFLLSQEALDCGQLPYVLVEVEKAPKPMPACATPVSQGMKVRTHSAMAKKAQQGVMEFLLINHPLDCPICDQGGECQLQDLAVGYGGGVSRYEEEKRVVVGKDMGPAGFCRRNEPLHSLHSLCALWSGSGWRDGAWACHIVVNMHKSRRFVGQKLGGLRAFRQHDRHLPGGSA
jgi:NADH dehydrogenase/NADH:ubiquinone oxidoreductase subunit G